MYQKAVTMFYTHIIAIQPGIYLIHPYTAIDYESVWLPKLGGKSDDLCHLARNNIF